MRELFLAPPRPRVDPPIPADKPVFRILTEQGYFGPDDTLHRMGELIVLFDEPNEDMEPMNDMARKSLESHLDKLETSSREVAKFNGRHFAGRARTKDEMLDHATSDSRRVQSLSNPGGVAIIGAKKDNSLRIQSVGDEPVADTGRKPATRSRIETISA